MDKQTLISQVRTLVSEAEPQQALQLLIPFLQSDSQYNKLAQIAYLAQAKLERNRKEEDSGTISREDAGMNVNLVSKTILNLADDLENNNLRPPRYEIQGNRISTKLIRILTGIFILLAIGLGTWIYLAFFNEEPAVIEGVECPEFPDNAEFNVLLLPFQSVAGQSMQAHISIKRRLADMSERFNLNTSIEIFKDYFENNDAPGPGEAKEIGQTCSARMVIWGTTESTGDSKIVSTSYRYLGEDSDKLKFKKIKLEGNNRLDTISTLSSIETEGKLTQDIEAIIYTIFGLVANRSQNYDAAIAILEESTAQDSSSIFLNNMILADSYLAQNNTQKAKEAYDKVLAVHPNYGFALNNRGVLHLKDKEYVDAIEDFNAKLELSPDDSEVLAARGAAYIKLEELEKAQEDLDKAKDIEPSSPIIQQNIERLDSVKQVKKRQKEEANQMIRRDRNNINALNQRAGANVSLGEETEQAISDSKQVLRKDSKNVQAYANLSDAYLHKGDTINVEKTITKAQRKGVKIEDIERIKPLVVKAIKKKKE